MSVVQPPSGAMWLLKRLGSGERHESLAGDLLEEYQRRRSPAWYWKQVLIATAVGAGRDIRVHKLLAVRAVVTGCGTLALVSSLLTRFAVNVLAKQVPPSWWTDHRYYPRGVEMVAILLMCIAAFSSGWIVARLHRAHQAGMVLAYFVSFIAYGLILLAAVPQRIPYHSYPYNLSAWAVVIGLYATSILLGGLWSAPAESCLKT